MSLPSEPFQYDSVTISSVLPGDGFLFNISPNVFYPKPRVNSKVIKFELINQNIQSKNLDFFLNLFFINKRKKIKSNKNIKDLIDKKIADKRYEDLKYTEVLDIYKRFNFS